MTILLAAQPDPERIRDVLRGERVKAAICCEMRFLSGSVFMSNWAVPFVSAGNQYAGLGHLVSLSAVQSGPDNLTEVYEYGLAIPPEISDLTGEDAPDLSRLPAMMGNEPEYAGRPAILSLQLFDADGAVGNPIVFHTGRLSRPRLSVTPDGVVTFGIDSESILVRQRTPRAGKLTDLDQQSRHAGDRGLSFVPNSVTAPLDWLNS